VKLVFGVVVGEFATEFTESTGPAAKAAEAVANRTSAASAVTAEAKRLTIRLRSHR
jgi:hypothetical protein